MWDLAEIPGVIVFVFITLTVSGGIVGVRQYRRYAEKRRTGKDPNDVLPTFRWVNYFKNNAAWLLKELKISSSSSDSSSRDIEMGSCSPLGKEPSWSSAQSSRRHRPMEVLAPDADDDIFTSRVSSEFGCSTVPDTAVNEPSSLAAFKGSADGDQFSIGSAPNEGNLKEALARFQDSNSPEPTHQGLSHSHVESWIEAISEASEDRESMVDSSENPIWDDLEIPLIVQAFGEDAFCHLTYSPEAVDDNPACPPADNLPMESCNAPQEQTVQSYEYQKRDSPLKDGDKSHASTNGGCPSYDLSAPRRPGGSESSRNGASSEDDDPFRYEAIFQNLPDESAIDLMARQPVVRTIEAQTNDHVNLESLLSSPPLSPLSPMTRVQAPWNEALEPGGANEVGNAQSSMTRLERLRARLPALNTDVVTGNVPEYVDLADFHVKLDPRIEHEGRSTDRCDDDVPLKETNPFSWDNFAATHWA